MSLFLSFVPFCNYFKNSLSWPTQYDSVFQPFLSRGTFQKFHMIWQNLHASNSTIYSVFREPSKKLAEPLGSSEPRLKNTAIRPLCKWVTTTITPSVRAWHLLRSVVNPIRYINTIFSAITKNYCKFYMINYWKKQFRIESKNVFIYLQYLFKHIYLGQQNLGPKAFIKKNNGYRFRIKRCPLSKKYFGWCWIKKYFICFMFCF